LEAKCAETKNRGSAICGKRKSRQLQPRHPKAAASDISAHPSTIASGDSLRLRLRALDTGSADDFIPNRALELHIGKANAAAA
jgi:hypothetical protein